MGACRAQCSAQTDLASAFEYGDGHHVGDAHATDGGGHRTEAEQQVLEVLVDLGPGLGLRMERPLVITDDGNEVVSKVPFEPYIVDC